MAPIFRFLLAIVPIFNLAANLHIALVASLAARRISITSSEAPPKPDPEPLFSPIEQPTGGIWQETVTREGSVLIIIHPHSIMHSHDHPSVTAHPGTADYPPTVAPSTPVADDTTTNTDTTAFPSGTFSTTAFSTIQSTTSTSSISTAIARGSMSSLSNSSSTDTTQTRTDTTSSNDASTTAITSSSSSPPPSATLTATTSALSLPSSSMEIPQYIRPIDSSQEQSCTGGSLEACIRSYDCSIEPVEVMRCYCRNNVAMGCSQACGSDKGLPLEDCPALPAGQPPDGLQGAGDGAQTPGVRAVQRPLILGTGLQELGGMLERPVRFLQRVQNLRE
ncbi:hypothetical protein TWF696_007758 [Orbilia brochopaga]|uniref:Uncharacterized protein n=1 Tax=Orbilia brochopaga TaxID=3140254 RepID=A0AAV9UL31_9PEZI